MTSGSNAKKKSVRGNRTDPKLLITEWVIKPAATPRHVNVSFVVQQESGEGANRTSTRHFRLQCENAAALLNELRDFLENASATQCLKEGSTSKVVAFNAPPERPSARQNAQDAESLSAPFALGAAYGLLGN
ncbi:hypothetical protein [Paraburkholderia sp. BR10954]|uniref:hypothetical protein n=1 Tax=Paraburkholderia sp. BR10954 TaxID=3236995 RepID=UPI0034D2EC4B